MLAEIDTSQWRYSGELVSHNVTEQWRILKAKTYAPQVVEVDLAELSRVDSAGLAMLICWQNQVKKCGGRLRFTHIPAQLAKLINVSDLETQLLSD